MRFGDLITRLRAYAAGHGVLRLIIELVHRGFGAGLAFCAWIILLPLSILMHVLGYRRLTVITQHIGHLAAEVDSLLKDQELGIVKRRRWLLLAPSAQTANRHLTEYWKKYLVVVENPA